MDDVQADDERQQTPAYALYPTKAVVWATAFGSPLAGGIVMAINYGRLGKLSAKRKTLLWSTIATIVLFTVVLLVPEDLPIP